MNAAQASFPQLPLALLLFALIAGCSSRGPAPVADREPGSVKETRSSPPVVTRPPVTAKGPTYLVRPGDTLISISRQTGVATRDLATWNGIVDPNQLLVGQALRLSPPNGPAVPAVPPREVEVKPVAPLGEAVEPQAAGPKDAPKGGKQPYSDEAWAQARNIVPPATPAAAAVEQKPTPSVEPASAATTGKPEVSSSIPWVWPTGGKLIAGFNGGSSKGIDIAGKVGDPVYAVASGKVAYAGAGLKGYGKLVIINHDENFLSAYGHNRELLVMENDLVTKGQKIAELGDTDAERPKLHFELRRLGKPVDPLKYLPKR